MPNSNLPSANAGSNKEEPSKDVEKWDECCKSGMPMIIGGVILGGCFSIATISPFPFLILSTLGIYSAVENCDNIFRSKVAEKSTSQQDKR